MNDLYLYGAGGHAKVIIEIAEIIGVQVMGLVDANPKVTTVLDYPVYQNSENGNEYWIISIGNNNIRKKISCLMIDKVFIKLIHPSSNISKRATIGVGTVIMAGVSINTGVVVGEHCVINTNASIDHDCHIENFVHISPNVALAGNVYIGEGVHLGIGACVIQGIKIGKWCTIGAGAVIINDIPDGATVVGNPGRIIKYKL